MRWLSRTERTGSGRVSVMSVCGEPILTAARPAGGAGGELRKSSLRIRARVGQAGLREENDIKKQALVLAPGFYPTHEKCAHPPRLRRRDLRAFHRFTWFGRLPWRIARRDDHHRRAHRCGVPFRRWTKTSSPGHAEAADPAVAGHEATTGARRGLYPPFTVKLHSRRSATTRRDRRSGDRNRWFARWRRWLGPRPWLDG